MEKTILVVLFLSLSFSCKTERKHIEKKEYPRMVGDIAKDPSIDDPDFKACDSLGRAAQYFHKQKSFAYTGEKAAVINIFKSSFKPLEKENQNGWIRIRFMVNCEGKTGRFRVLESDFNYEPFKFDSEITKKLLDITKGLNGWEPGMHEDHTYDYYQYLIFKIENGHLIEILP